MANVLEEATRERMVSRLRELGLSTHEALTYVTLLANPRATASTLCKETLIPDSKIYYALDGLSKKGMILVQQGNPNLYTAVHPREAVANLKRQLTESLNERMKEADALVDSLSPIYESAESPAELELAYIIRTKKNIVKKMNDLINSAKKEVTVLVQQPEILQRIKDSLIGARKRRVKLNIALTDDILKQEDLAELGQVKRLLCPCNIIIIDMKTLLTTSAGRAEMAEMAIMTQDQNLITVSKEYFDNPKCCT